MDDEIKCEQVGQIVGQGYNDMIGRVYGTDGLSPTIRTMVGGNNEPKILVPEATKKGYDTATYGDSINMAYPNSKTRRGRVGHGVAQTLTTGDAQQVVIEPKIITIGNYSPSGHNASNIVDTKGIAPTVMENHGTVTAITEPRICAMRGRNPDNPSDRTAGSPTEQRLEIGSEETSNTLTTVQKDNLVVEPQYRIRKLTERECFRLMGVKEDDFERVAKNQSTSSCYHLSGDAIAVSVLMAIFGQLFGVDYQTKINELIGELRQ